MDYLKQYVIPYVGLKQGNHEFDFEIGKAFFDCFEGAEIGEGQLKVHCTLEKQERMMIWDFKIDGTLRVHCDRCLEELDYPVSGEDQLIVKFGEDVDDEADDVIYISEKEYEIDLSQHIYDFIILKIPYKMVHGNDEKGNSLCNPTVVELINKHKPAEANDPRWDALKNLDLTD